MDHREAAAKDLLKGGFAGGSGVLNGRLAQQLARSSASRLPGLLGEVWDA
jgi:hypothetical protein